MNKDTDPNYKGIGHKILSEGVEKLSNQDLELFLSTGISFISAEIEDNRRVASQIKNQPEDVQEHLPHIALLRLVYLYEASQKNNLQESESVKIFGRLVTYCKEKMDASGEHCQDDLLVKVLKKSFTLVDEDEYIDKLGKKMNFVRSIVADIIPDNSKAKIQEKPLEFKLD